MWFTSGKGAENLLGLVQKWPHPRQAPHAEDPFLHDGDVFHRPPIHLTGRMRIAAKRG
jgi:hypothetical protein